VQIVINRYPADILTAHYRVYGELVARGDPTIYFNASDLLAIAIADATLMPLRQGMRLGAVSMDELFIPRSEPQVIILGGYEPTVKPLPRKEHLICFTDTYLLRGTFHMGMDTRPEDVFFTIGGRMYHYATNLDIYSLYPLAVDVKASAELAFVRGDAVRAFYLQEAGSQVAP
jgi:hypothetical protein